MDRKTKKQWFKKIADNNGIATTPSKFGVTVRLECFDRITGKDIVKSIECNTFDELYAAIGYTGY